MLTPDDPRITAYLLGELSDQERNEIREEIENSDALKSAVGDLQEIISRLDSSKASIDSEEDSLSEEQQADIAAAARAASASQIVAPTKSPAKRSSSNVSGWGIAAAAVLVCAIGVTGVLLYKPDSLTQLASSFSGKTEISTLEGGMPGENSSIAQRDETNVVEQSEAGLETLTLRQQILEAKDMAAEVAEDEFAGERSLGGSANGQFETPPDRPLLDASANEFGEFGDFAKAAGPGAGSGELASTPPPVYADQTVASDGLALDEEAMYGGSSGLGEESEFDRLDENTSFADNVEATADPFTPSPRNLSSASRSEQLFEMQEGNHPFGEGQEQVSSGGMGMGGGGMGMGAGYGGEGMRMGLNAPAPAAGIAGEDSPAASSSHLSFAESEVSEPSGDLGEPAVTSAPAAFESPQSATSLSSDLDVFRDQIARQSASLPQNSRERGYGLSNQLSDELITELDEAPAIRVIELLSSAQGVDVQLTDDLRRRLAQEEAFVDLPEDQPITNEQALSLAKQAMGARFKRRDGRVWLDVATPADEEGPSEGKSPDKVTTWRPATASANAARLSVGHHDDLQMTARDSYVRIDGFRARVLLDYYYYNDRPQQLEGSFKLRLPADAALHYFAFGTVNVAAPPADVPTPTPGKGGEIAEQLVSVDQRMLTAIRDNLKDGGADLARRATDPAFGSKSNAMFSEIKTAKIVERQKAALAYEETVRRRVDPALVEWSGPGIFQTKVFPLVPNRMHRIVIGYDVSLKPVDGGLQFDLDLPEEQAGGRVEFDIAATPGAKVVLTPECEAFVSGDRAYYRYETAAAQDYSVRIEQPGPILLTSNDSSGKHFATRIKLDLPEEQIAEDADGALFLLDTSWSQQAGAFHRWVGLLQEILRANEKEITKFNVLFFNVEQRLWRESSVPNNAESRELLLRDCEQLILEGATDLEGALSAAVDRCQVDRDLADANLFLLSDGAGNWGNSNLMSLAQPILEWNERLKSSEGVQGGALFSYTLSGISADKVVLDYLASVTGGAVFEVADAEDITNAATAHLSRPWTIEGLDANGADDILIGGGQNTVYPQQRLTIAGKGAPIGAMLLKLRRGDQKREIEINSASTVKSALAGRIYGGLAVDQLEPLGNDFTDVTVAYARQFGVPGKTCSMVMLESEADYARFHIDHKEDPLVVQTTSVPALVKRSLQQARELRANSKREFARWVESLETSSSPLLARTTSLKLAMEQMPVDAFEFNAKALRCRMWMQDQISTEYMDNLNSGQPDMVSIFDEADQRLIKSGAADAIKAVSTAVEISPSDPSTLRAVAFNAIHWNRSDQAAHLLRRLAVARPYQPQSLLLLARCYQDADKADAALVCYELVASGLWNQRWHGSKPIAELSLLHLLEEIESGKQKSSVSAYASARLAQLRTSLASSGLDLAVVMHWNTDRTDVDLHVIEPSGEECFYKHKKTRSGGSITQDITEGLGPEMYKNENAPAGDFDIRAKYFRSDRNTTRAPTATLVTVYRNLGRPGSSARSKLVRLAKPDEKIHVMTSRVGSTAEEKGATGKK